MENGLHWLNSVEGNRLPFLYHTSSKSKEHPVPQQMLPANSSSVQRRIPNSEHSCLAFANVSVEQSGVSLSQDPPSKLQHLTAPVWVVEIISWEFWVFSLGQPDARPYVPENKYLMIIFLESQIPCFLFPVFYPNWHSILQVSKFQTRKRPFSGLL